MMNKVAVIVQARVKSTRLPNKILRAFYDGKSILELLIDKLKCIEHCCVVIATSTDNSNDEIANLANNKGVKCYRGSENDVLGRFIEAAEEVGATRIVRICSDNPFLELESLKKLISWSNNNLDADYIGFKVNGTPSIKTHYGFWGEYVTLNGLKAVEQATQEGLYHEHVTNYIYANSDKFNIKWIEVGERLNDSIRLTIDTETDFKNCQYIYSMLVQGNQYPTIAEVMEFLDNNKHLYKQMRIEIDNNTK